ncbi:metal-dependent hydrolase family protein [Halorarius litoreus]|uniref:metal-dependent hydrolase family protein n=1 Tax=Halorarius litoreus TaxID=2962676 RepID=UPI0020CBC6AF|nr:amidohydrolase family protein [Halorarius litoreus]
MYVDCGTLFTGTDVVADGRIAIEDGRVLESGPQDAVEATGDRLDLAAEVVTPGFVDAHLHLKGARSMDPMDWVADDTALSAARAVADAERLLDAGFTTVRDVGSNVAIGVRDAIAAEEVPGPRVFAAGLSISQTGGHGDLHMLPREWVKDGAGISELADGEDECRRVARKRARQGADVLKIMTTGGVLSEKDSPTQAQFTDSEVAAMVEEAHRVGMPVASHAQGAAGVKRALENGVDTIEHGFHLDDECLDLFLEREATFVPTLAIMHRIVTAGADHGVPEHGLQKAREAREAHLDSVERAIEAGVPIATGTDFIGPDLVPHGENALELELLVEEVGLSVADAIASATTVAGRTVPDDSVGGLEAGNYADFLVLGGDPRDDLGALRDVREVYRKGERVRQ